MKIIQSNSGFSIIISNEQHQLLDKFQTHEHILKRQLTEREQVLASELTQRGVLTRCEVDRKLAYCLPNPNQIWRI
jgi:ribose 1,5-bisphosphokinase PhnN